MAESCTSVFPNVLYFIFILLTTLPFQRSLSLFSKQRFHTLQFCGPGCPEFFAFLSFWLPIARAARSRFLFCFQWSCRPAGPVRHTRSALQWEAPRSSCT